MLVRRSPRVRVRGIRKCLDAGNIPRCFSQVWKSQCVTSKVAGVESLDFRARPLKVNAQVIIQPNRAGRRCRKSGDRLGVQDRGFEGEALLRLT